MPKPAATALLVLLTACSITPSEVAADARIEVTGIVSYQDGGPATDVPVSLVRHEGVAESLTAVLTLGATCLGDDKALSVCKSARRASTGRNGRYSFRLTGRDTQGLVGDASTLEATAQLPRARTEASGPSATVRFLVQTERVDVPLHMWEPAVEAVADARAGTVTWTDVPAAVVPAEADAAGAIERVAFQRGAGELVWQAPGRSGLATFDPRVLEDSRGTVSVAAEWKNVRVHDERGRMIDLILRSARMPYRSRAGAPPSRGAACWWQAGGAVVPMVPCPLTDGEFATPAGQPACPGETPCGPATDVVVDRGAAAPLALIVVRGCRDRCLVSTSTDAKRWTPAGSIAGSEVALPIAKPVTARYVRVGGEDLDTLREVSLWLPPGPAADPRSILAEVSGLAPPVDRLFRGEGRARPILAAALLLALIGGALGATALQNRRPATRRS